MYIVENNNFIILKLSYEIHLMNAEFILIKKQLWTAYIICFEFTIRIYIWLLWVSRSQKFGSLLGSLWTTLLYCLQSTLKMVKWLYFSAGPARSSFFGPARPVIQFLILAPFGPPPKSVKFNVLN